LRSPFGEVHARPALRLLGFLALALGCVSLALTGRALAASSGASAWGDNEYGQLGNATKTSSDVPVAVSGLSEVKQIAAGQNGGGVLLADGTVMAWGENYHGQLGDGTTNDSEVPVAVCALGEAAPCNEHLSGVKEIASGSGHTLALLEDGTVLAWGENDSGQLGDGNEANSYVPVEVQGLSGVKAIAAGGDDSLAILEDGTLMAWGGNSEGRLGEGKTWSEVESSDVPVTVCEVGASAPCAQHLSGVTGAAAGYSSTTVLLSNGTVVAMGSNTRGELGAGVESPEYTADVPVAVCAVGESAPCAHRLSGVTSVAAGSFFNFAVLANGTAVGWGENASGQLGDGTETGFDVPTAAPVEVSGLSDVKAIAAGYSHTLALLEDGTVMAWGNGEAGNLGNGTTDSSDLPVAVSGLRGVTAIASGSGYDLAVGPRLANVAGVEPDGGPLGGGTSVSIVGSGFSEATAVTFGSTDAASFKVNSETSITAISPAGAGTVGVTVATPGGDSAPSPAGRFTYGVSVQKVEPDEGQTAGGTSVAITGTNFAGAGAVKFGSTEATSFKVNSNTSITAVSPAGSGVMDVTVNTPEGTSPTSSADLFTFNDAPIVKSLSPSSGEESGGTSVTITGTNFTGATAVKFGSTDAVSFEVQSPTSITAVSPPGEGQPDVTVATPQGISPTSAADRFHYDGESTCSPRASEGPIITSIQPNTGPSSGGTSVRIVGEHFFASAECRNLPLGTSYFVRKVMFGSKEALSFEQQGTEGVVTAIAPPGTGTVDVTVETFATSPTSPADQFKYPGPAIESESASNISQSDATLEAQINPAGFETEYEFYLESPWCGTFGPGACEASGGVPIAHGVIPAGTSPQTVSVDIASAFGRLSAGTIYGYRVTTTSTDGESSGRLKTFKTEGEPIAESPPTEVATEPAESGSSGFRLTGRLNPGNSPTNYYFEYIANDAYECLEGENCWRETAHEGPITGDSQQGVGSIEVTGLRLGETYRYRLVAENAKGTVRGNVVTFTVTQTFPASVGSESVSNITENAATLEAKVNPHGELTYLTTWVFEYGTSTSYGQSVPFPPGVFNSEACKYEEDVPCTLFTTPQPVSESLTGLAPATTYHYRIAATNSWGTSYGEDRTFTTLSSRARPLGGETEPTGNGAQSGASSATGQGGSSGTPGAKLPGSSGKTVSPKVLTEAQKLAKALKQCEREPKHKRAECKKQAHKKYAPEAKKKHKKR
jgi:alpha-tubulin suppressor-like RCC1 family protein